MEKQTVNGISLAYQRQGTGIPMLLVHGFPLDHSTWEALAPRLESHFDLILPDLRGFGQSDAPDAAYTIAQMAADLAGLLVALHIPQACIAGHSMGGYVTLAFASQYPERVLGLGLIASQTAPDGAERRAARYDTARQVKQDGVKAVAGMAEKLSTNPDHVAFLREIILGQKPLGVIGALQAMAERPEGSQALITATYPIVLVHGLADVLIPSERSREIKSLVPRAMLTELPGVGHSPMLEAPLETAQALSKLLASL